MYSSKDTVLLCPRFTAQEARRVSKNNMQRKLASWAEEVVRHYFLFGSARIYLRYWADKHWRNAPYPDLPMRFN